MANKKVREAAPLQVYLVSDERDRLERLAEQLDASKSDVVRRALLALERELLSPATHPALRLIGIAETEQPSREPIDGAREHDRVLAETEEASWATPTRRGGDRSARRTANKRRAR
ncbi:MAG TPA: ribbon-helix-helix protein, CopG family [Gemmatimonadaceae bacterium]|nr:ribbon-helix-helix protein, CopG family [Gemmatimonadaceae bacterium]